MPISVLLSTYNGARYLPEQLASLWAQTHQDFELIVRDDGSSDDTLQVLADAQRAHPGRLRVLAPDGRRLGPKGSFAALLEHTHTPYVAFCDQDDQWLPHKLETLHAALRAEEARSGASTPLLACSDATVADALLQPATPSSYFARHRFRAVDGRDLVLPRIVFRNVAIGATTMINAALVECCRPIPDAAVMHDWWCALVATVRGRVLVLPESTMLYRQHGGNAVGSKRRAMPRSRAQASEALAWSQDMIVRCIAQATALRDQQAASLSVQDRQVLDALSHLAHRSAWGRAATLFRTRAFKPGFALNGLHLLACMTTARPPR